MCRKADEFIWYCALNLICARYTIENKFQTEAENNLLFYMNINSEVGIGNTEKNQKSKKKSEWLKGMERQMNSLGKAKT